MNLLEVKNISKTYGNGETAVKALKDVCFSVPKGEYVAIVGESGSGKSTLLNMIGALDTPTYRSQLEYQNLFLQFCACCRYFCHLDFVHERTRSNPNKEKGQKGSSKERLVMIL